MYGMKDYAKIVYDNAEWYKKSAGYFLKTYPLEVHQFVMLDFSTLYDRDSFHQMIKEVLGITYLDIIERPVAERDSEQIVLYNNSSFEFIDLVNVLYNASYHPYHTKISASTNVIISPIHCSTAILRALGYCKF